jgi:hypothetical protein
MASAESQREEESRPNFVKSREVVNKNQGLLRIKTRGRKDWDAIGNAKG